MWPSVFSLWPWEKGELLIYQNVFSFDNTGVVVHVVILLEFPTSSLKGVSYGLKSTEQGCGRNLGLSWCNSDHVSCDSSGLPSYLCKLYD